MILFVHMLFGAAVGSSVNNIPLAIILALLSHYLLDFIPHIDYPLKDTDKKNFILMLPNILKIALDFGSGILLIFLFSKNHPIIYVCAIAAILPDGFTVLNALMPNKILKFHSKLHPEKVHYFKDKKISNFWRISSQVAVAVISVLILRY